MCAIHMTAGFCKQYGDMLVMVNSRTLSLNVGAKVWGRLNTYSGHEHHLAHKL